MARVRWAGVAPQLHAFATHGTMATALRARVLGEPPTFHIVRFRADGRPAGAVAVPRAAVVGVR